MRYDKKTLREIEKKDGVYTPSQAEEYLRDRYDYYLEKKRAAGYVLRDSAVSFRKDQGSYRLSGTVQFEKKQDTYKAIRKKKKELHK